MFRAYFHIFLLLLVIASILLSFAGFYYKIHTASSTLSYFRSVPFRSTFVCACEKCQYKNGAQIYGSQCALASKSAMEIAVAGPDGIAPRKSWTFVTNPAKTGAHQNSVQKFPKSHKAGLEKKKSEKLPSADQTSHYKFKNLREKGNEKQGYCVCVWLQ